jgi:DNA (cytosine-5)-methyltransferase 1
MEDVRDVRRKHLKSVDVVCGGFPCQDVSVAGRRAGLAGERSGLWFEFHRIIAESNPRWVVIENVPGLLSSNAGRDFAVILRGLVECGYGVAWRILDAQYFGVAQRRRRVFVVGSLGNGRAAQVLFEREIGAWDYPPRRKTGTRIAAGLTRGTAASRGVNDPGRRREDDENIVVSYSVSAKWAKGTGGPSGDESQNLITTFNGYTGGADDNDAQGGHLVAFENHGNVTGDIAETIRSGSHGALPMIGVRRLTPLEVERLQGFPDGWTAVNGQSDSVRYRQLGNAVCPPVAEWIGRRIVGANARWK